MQTNLICGTFITFGNGIVNEHFTRKRWIWVKRTRNVSFLIYIYIYIYTKPFELAQ